MALGLGHDLNNILQSIFIASQLLQEVVEDESSRALVQSIRASAIRGAALVGDVLAFARGRSTDRSPTALQPVVADAANVAILTFPGGIQVQARLDPDLWPVRASANQLYGVLINLLANARDALPNGGKIQLESANVRLGSDQLGGLRLEPGRHVVLRVSDNGTGIVESLRERIFEPFFTTKSTQSGTGIGLWQARHIVRDHGGDIRVTSEVGLGTIFEVFLPCEPRKDSPAAPAIDPAFAPDSFGALPGASAANHRS